MVEWATLAVTVLGLGGLLLQIRAAAQAQRRDHERQRRQATLDAWNHLFEWRSTIWEKLPNDRDIAAVKAYCPDPDDTEHPHFKSVVTYLNYLENLAVGVHHGVYDVVVLDALAGGRVMAAWQGYGAFVRGRREILSAPTLWSELEALACEIEQLPE